MSELEKLLATKAEIASVLRKKILVTEAVTAELISCSTKTVYNLRKAGELPFVRPLPLNIGRRN